MQRYTYIDCTSAPVLFIQIQQEMLDRVMTISTPYNMLTLFLGIHFCQGRVAGNNV